jgi:hypothetical protein
MVSKRLGSGGQARQTAFEQYLLGAEALQIRHSFVVIVVIVLLVVVVVVVAVVVVVVGVLVVGVVLVLTVVAVVAVVLVFIVVVTVVLVFVVLVLVVIVVVVILVVVRGRWGKVTTLAMRQMKVITGGNEPMAPSGALVALGEIGKCQ